MAPAIFSLRLSASINVSGMSRSEGGKVVKCRVHNFLKIRSPKLSWDLFVLPGYQPSGYPLLVIKHLIKSKIESGYINAAKGTDYCRLCVLTPAGWSKLAEGSSVSVNIP